MVVGELRQERDVIIIGGGPGGYTAAIRAAQLGLEVSIIEQTALGGNCLHKACIPSKIWAHIAKKRAQLPHMQELGLEVEVGSPNLTKLQSYQAKIIAQLRQGVEALCQTNKIEIIQGKAVFTAEDRLGVELGHQFDTYQFKQVIIATGSSPVLPSNLEKIMPQHSPRVLLAQQIFELVEIPKHLLVLGHDYIALEIASIYAALGSQVTLLIEEDSVFPFDVSISRELTRLFKKKRIPIIKYTELLSVEERANLLHITIQTRIDQQQTIEATHLFVSGVRKPNVESLGIERFGVEQNEEGFLVVNEHMQTTVPNVYAIGDVTEGPLLAVKAIKQGKVAAEAIAGRNPELDLTFLPYLTHTLPPIATVGITEQSAKELGLDIRVSQFPLGSNGYALLSGNREGVIKVITDSSTDLLLGVHMLGEGAIELSSTFVQLLEMAAKEEDILFPAYGHPSISESLLEAVEGLTGIAIHIPPTR